MLTLTLTLPLSFSLTLLLSHLLLLSLPLLQSERRETSQYTIMGSGERLRENSDVEEEREVHDSVLVEVSCAEVVRYPDNEVRVNQ